MDFSRIDTLAAQPESLRPLDSTELKRLREEFMIENTYNSNAIEGNTLTLGAAHTPPEPYLVPEQMANLLADFDRWKQERHIIEAVAEFHLRFEGVHPFIDGNGRTGRLLLNLGLIRAGLLPVNIKFADRRKYYDCFDNYASSGSPESMTALIAGYEQEELVRYIGFLTPHETK